MSLSVAASIQFIYLLKIIYFQSSLAESSGGASRESSGLRNRFIFILLTLGKNGRLELALVTYTINIYVQILKDKKVVRVAPLRIYCRRHIRVRGRKFLFFFILVRRWSHDWVRSMTRTSLNLLILVDRHPDEHSRRCLFSVSEHSINQDNIWPPHVILNNYLQQGQCLSSTRVV